MTHDKFSTSDIILAAYLVTQHYKLISISVSGNKGTFHFINVEDSEITAYDTGSSLVEPITFNNAIKQLTSAVRRKLSE